MRAMASVLGLVVAWAVLEVVVRARARTDADGNQTAFGGRLRPFAPPVEWTRARAEELASGKHPCFRYDPDLGWRNNPRTRCHKGSYIYDQAGLRSPSVKREPARAREPGVLRVGLFGDSFTHGDGVVYAQTWGHVLEQNLREQGVEAQVFNFGVGGYGIDQALLRWRKDGTGFGLDVVVLGFQSENILRSLNMIRVLYFWRTRLPFTKPRFVLRDGALEVLNQPTIGPEALPEVLADLEHWPLREYDEFYVPSDFEPRWWHASRLLGYLSGWKAHHVGRLFYEEQQRYYAVDGEPAALTLAMLAAFEEEVRSAGAQFYVVHLPKKIDLDRVSEDPESLWYAELRDEIEKRHAWVETEKAFMDAAAGSSVAAMFGRSEHYSPEGNAVVGASLAERLVADRE